jgi:hypothetical protein
MVVLSTVDSMKLGQKETLYAQNIGTIIPINIKYLLSPKNEAQGWNS